MRTVHVLLVVLLLGCTKEPVRLNVRLHATCKMCAVEFKDDGVIYRDTIIGEIRYNWQQGVSFADTIPCTSAWNVVRIDGASVDIKACRIRSVDDGGISIVVSGDVERIEQLATFPSTCAIVNTSVHQ